MDNFTSTSADLLIHHGIPWLGKKAVEMVRYYTSEAMRNPKLQKKAIDYTLDKLNPIIQNVGSKSFDQLSTKIRPNKKYKTDRKDLDGSGIIDSLLSSGVVGSPFHVNYKKGIKLLTNPELWSPVNKMSEKDAKTLVQYYKDQYKDAKKNGYSKSYNTFIKEMGWGKGFDIHKLIGKLPKPKSGWTPSKYKFMGPYNPLDKQLEYDKNTGEVLRWHQLPYNKVDEIAAHHDICYDMGKNKGECDKQMVKSLDMIPYGEMPKWGQTARFLINTKQKLGLGLNNNNKKIYCGAKDVPKNKKRGSIADCVKANQIRYYGLNSINEKVFNNMKKANKLKKEQEKFNKSSLFKNFDKNKKYTTKELKTMLKENKKLKNMVKQSVF